MKQPCVYIITNKRNGTLYIGVTSNRSRRMYEYKQKLIEGFAKIYGLDKLVYYEIHDTMEAAIAREKQLKKRSRKAKLALIDEFNPNWDDLYETLL